MTFHKIYCMSQILNTITNLKNRNEYYYVTIALNPDYVLELRYYH